jgi:hypothetical protein
MDHTAIIDRYLGGEMTPEERADFERRLAEDAGLARELALQQKIKRALADAETRQFHTKLHNIRQERASRKRRIKRLWVWGGPLLVCSLLLFAWYYFRGPVPTTLPVSPPVISKDTLPPAAIQDSSHTPQVKTIRPRTNTPVSTELAGMIEDYHREYLLSSVGVAHYMSDSSFASNAAAIDLAFEQKDYDKVLAIAKSYPEHDEKYNTVAWTAANAAFLAGNCNQVFHYAGKINNLKASKTKAQDAELLLLLAAVKCSRIQEQPFQDLLAKARKDVFHPAYQLALALKR